MKCFFFLGNRHFDQKVIVKCKIECKIMQIPTESFKIHAKHHSTPQHTFGFKHSTRSSTAQTLSEDAKEAALSLSE